MSSTAAPDDSGENKRNIPITYARVMEIHGQLAQVLVKLDGVSALAENQLKQELRIRSLEIDLATLKATTTQRSDTWAYVFMGAMTVGQLGLTFFNAVLK